MIYKYNFCKNLIKIYFILINKNLKLNNYNYKNDKNL